MTEQTNPYVNYNAETAEDKPKKRPRWKTPVYVVAALMVGTAVGLNGSDEDSAVASDSDPEPAPTETVTAEPEPAPTVTETAEAEPAPTETVTETPDPETVTETVSETPEACVDALNKAEEVFGIYSDGMFAAADGFDAASRYDLNALDRATQDLTDLQGPLDRGLTDYYIYAMDCEGTL